MPSDDVHLIRSFFCKHREAKSVKLIRQTLIERAEWSTVNELPMEAWITFDIGSVVIEKGTFAELVAIADRNEDACRKSTWRSVASPPWSPNGWSTGFRKELSSSCNRMEAVSEKYPLCSAMGVLRQSCRDGMLTIATATLHNKLGWEVYRTYLPLMKHVSQSGPTPESCEAWLATLDLSQHIQTETHGWIAADTKETKQWLPTTKD